MALPNQNLPQKIMFPGVVPNMANQATFEGFLARAWIHNGFRFLRLANQRLPQAGAQSDGPLMVESDYVTIRLDPAVYFEMNRAKEGLRLLVHGRIEGHDIPETIGDILRHCNLNVRVPQDIAHLTVSRPAVQIYCTHLEFYREDNSNSQKPWKKPGQDSRRADRRHFHGQPGGAATGPRSQAPITVPAASVQDGTPLEEGAQPGQDISEIAAAIDARKASRSRKASPKAAAAQEPAAKSEKKEPKARKTTD
jgi:hypothetical protein